MRYLLSNIIAVFIVCIVLFIIIPLPPALLDFMFMLNISVALTILLMSMYIKETLELSIFPTLMLVTTIFRLSLNVSSIRLILGGDINPGTGRIDASRVIDTFGNFVAGGNVAIGFVIFLVIVFVNFLVITKGSERVAEVTARFTLDAMPGKQMAIDADLNTGLIDDQEAKERRLKIQRESDFYGSMDGAVKFVKGDAIAAIVIIILELVGGIIIGLVMSSGMTFMDVVNTYVIAVVGDGLVSQIPALLISVSCGMIVTRANSDNNLNIDIARQMLSQPTALMIAGAAVTFMAMIPGSPTLQIVIIGGGLFTLGVILHRSRRPKPAMAAAGA
ncbi:MAG: flagellar biosynthesis protein FlhA, partial [Oscillospiraceae bacterium]|nr:flagellar biosynthesis protein FlhA [Oscillospiraceae bacterium]